MRNTDLNFSERYYSRIDDGSWFSLTTLHRLKHFLVNVKVLSNPIDFYRDSDLQVNGFITLYDLELKYFLSRRFISCPVWKIFFLLFNYVSKLSSFYSDQWDSSVVRSVTVSSVQDDFLFFDFILHQYLSLKFYCLCAKSIVSSLNSRIVQWSIMSGKKSWISVRESDYYSIQENARCIVK